MKDTDPNRETGAWLPNVESCPKRAIPCGNPSCADQAMRAKQIIEANPDDIVAAKQAAQAVKHAYSIANHCGMGENCPLEIYFQCDRDTALNKLAGID